MIQFVPEASSTSSEIAARLASGDSVAEGDWLVADRQTAGRGRHGRVWFDGTGNFMGSTVVRPRASDPSPASLALVTGLAVHATVAEYLPSNTIALLKWPNDVLIEGAKIAGVLLEASGSSVVIGIGVNLTVAPSLPDRATIALASLHKAPERDDFATALAERFALELQRWRDFGLSPIVRRWLAAAHPIGTRLLVGEPDEPAIEGTFAGLTDDGALQLRLADGTVRVIHAGEVRLGDI